MTDTDRFFELNDDVGVTADGNLEPLVRQGLTVAVPTMAAGEVVDLPASIVIEAAERIGRGEHARILPGTRIVQSRDPRVSDGLMQTGCYHEVDPPSKTAVTEAKRETKHASQEAGTHSEPDEEVTV